MATIRKIIDVAAPAAKVWDVVRDVGAVHTRFAPGFVVSTVLEEGARVVTFANGLVARELIVDVNEALRRLAYAIRSDQLQHHNASFEVVEVGPQHTHLVWTADVLPEAAGERLSSMMEIGAQAAAQALNDLGA
jgi:Polyketide cyclase / dehydrase and lipid transport